MPQRPVKLCHHLWCRPFLWTKHRRSPFLAGQRVSHVAGHINLTIRQTAVQRADIDLCQRAQTGATVGEWLIIRRQQLRAQRLNHSRAAIIGGATAQTDDDALHAQI